MHRSWLKLVGVLLMGACPVPAPTCLLVTQVTAKPMALATGLLPDGTAVCLKQEVARAR